MINWRDFAFEIGVNRRLVTTILRSRRTCYLMEVRAKRRQSPQLAARYIRAPPKKNPLNELCPGRTDRPHPTSSKTILHEKK